MVKDLKEKTSFEKLDDDLTEFYNDLKRKNFNDDDIREIFKPILPNKKFIRGRTLLLFTSAFLLFQVLIRSQTVWWYFLTISRLFLVQIKPFYDWSHLKNEQCLVSKWWKKDISKNFTPNCNLCENFKSIEVFDYLDAEKLEELYIEVQKAVVLEYEGFPTGDHLWSSFFQDENFLLSIPCSLQTNVIENEANVGKILRKMSVFDSFFVHFQNCEYGSMKYFRKLVNTPDLGTKNLSPVQYNWLIWTKNYTFLKFKKIDLVNSENLKFVCQIEGEVIYRLLPPDGCKEACVEVGVVLKKGQVLVLTNFWELEYRIEGEDENVAVVLEAHSIL